MAKLIGYSRQHCINEYYIEKAYKSMWATTDTFLLDDLDDDFLQLTPQKVLTNDFNLIWENN